MIRIDDEDDPRIAAYRDIREKDLVGRQGHFIAEGEVVLNVLARSRTCEAVSALIAEQRAEKLAPLLQTLGCPVYLAGQGVLDRVAGFHLHRGILALGRRKPGPGAADLLTGLPDKALVLALHGIANHDNMGGLFRNAAAFGVDAVILDATSCDPLYRKAIRVSVGGVLQVPFARTDGDLADLLLSQGFEVLALTPAGAMELKAVRAAARSAVLLGAEGPGLPATLIAKAKGVRVAMAGGFDSLNVATTAGIVLHHLRSNPTG
ncbi:MAG: RNA methyltransferase [Caulobacteraceae bacterium]